MDYDSFVTRLRITRSYLANHPTHGSWEEAGVVEQAADAIVALRSDLAAAQARVEELESLTIAQEWIRLGKRAERAEADLAAARALLRDCRSLVRCESLDHYRKADQHDGFGPCPIEMRMKDAIDVALAGEKK